MNIVVNATAVRSSGALTIYEQFISHLEKNIGGNRYYIFVDPSMPQPKIENVTYFTDDNHGWIHRTYWDYFGCVKWLKKHNIKPDVIVSLQNSGVITNCKQVVYYHQSLPFYDKNWNFLKKEEGILGLYKYVYPLIIAPTFSKNTDVVVQIPFIKRGFIERFKHPKDRVHVLFPDTYIEIPEDNEEDVELRQRPYFIYPAIGADYKQHRTIANAVSLIKTNNSELAGKIRVLFTLDRDKNSVLSDYIKSKGCEDNFEFIGRVDYKKLMRLVKNSQALLFPSIIETLGLPLVEAAAMGKAIIASDRDYSREVLPEYSGVTFLPYDAYDKWAEEIVRHYESYKQYTPIEQQESSWGKFFDLIDNKNMNINIINKFGGGKNVVLLPEYVREVAA